MPKPPLKLAPGQHEHYGRAVTGLQPMPRRRPIHCPACARDITLRVCNEWHHDHDGSLACCDPDQLWGSTRPPLATGLGPCQGQDTYPNHAEEAPAMHQFKVTKLNPAQAKAAATVVGFTPDGSGKTTAVFHAEHDDQLVGRIEQAKTQYVGHKRSLGIADKGGQFDQLAAKVRLTKSEPLPEEAPAKAEKAKAPKAASVAAAPARESKRLADGATEGVCRVCERTLPASSFPTIDGPEHRANRCRKCRGEARIGTPTAKAGRAEKLSDEVAAARAAKQAKSA